MLLKRDPYAYGRKYLFPINDERRCQCAHQSLGDQGGVARIFYLIEQDRELVSTEPRYREQFLDPCDRIASPQAIFQPICDSNQELISDHMTQTVVDHLEPVEVQEHDCKQIILVAFRSVRSIVPADQ